LVLYRLRVSPSLLNIIVLMEGQQPDGISLLPFFFRRLCLFAHEAMQESDVLSPGAVGASLI